MTESSPTRQISRSRSSARPTSGLVREHNEDNFLVADVTGAVRARPTRASRSSSSSATRARCSWSATAWAAPPPARSRRRWRSTRSTTRWPPPSRSRATGSRACCAARSQHANERIFIQSRDNQSERGMGTTCTVAALVDDTLVVGADRRLALLRPARRQAGPGHQGPVAGLAADRGGRHDRRRGQGLRARQHHPAGAGRAGARRGGAVAGAAAPGRRGPALLGRAARPGQRRGDPGRS